MARLRDDLGLFFVVLGVQHVVGDPLALEKLRQKLRFFDRDRADQHRLPLGVAFLDLRDDRAVFARLGLIDDVRVVDTDDGLVRRDLDDIEVVDGGKLLLLGHGGFVLRQLLLNLLNPLNQQLHIGFWLAGFGDFLHGNHFLQPVGIGFRQIQRQLGAAGADELI